MTIRLAKIEDTNAIVQLLKESLGEKLLKKSTSIWNFKHHQNPFGESLVLLAEENNQIIGVRAFMKWQWQDDGGEMAAARWQHRDGSDDGSSETAVVRWSGRF